MPALNSNTGKRKPENINMNRYTFSIMKILNLIGGINSAKFFHSNLSQMEVSICQCYYEIECIVHSALKKRCFRIKKHWYLDFPKPRTKEINPSIIMVLSLFLFL